MACNAARPGNLLEFLLVEQARPGIGEPDRSRLTLQFARKDSLDSVCFQDAQDFQDVLAAASRQAGVTDFWEVLFFWGIDGEATDLREVAILVLVAPTCAVK